MRIGEVNTSGQILRKALTNQGTGRNHVTRNVGSSNQPRDGKDHRSNFGFRALNSQQRSSGQDMRAGQSNDHRSNFGFRALNSQQRISGQDMRAGQSNITRDVNQSQHYGRMPKASTVQGRQVGSLGSLHTAQNGTQGAGPMRRRQAAGISGARNKAVEIVTLDSDSEDETFEEMQTELVRMVERKLGRKRSHPETRGKYYAF